MASNLLGKMCIAGPVGEQLLAVKSQCVLAIASRGHFDRVQALGNQSSQTTCGCQGCHWPVSTSVSLEP